MTKHKSITIKKKVAEKMGLSTEKVMYLLEQSLKEKESLRKLAFKITKVPETVRVYSPSIKKNKEKNNE